MPLQYLKKAPKTSKSDASDVNEVVQNILNEIEQGGDEAALKYARKFDNYDGNIELTKAEIEAAFALVPERLKADIRFAHDNVKRFAQAQKATLADIEYEVIPGLIAGQKSIPVRAAGCYIPGGRYSHIASAIMTVTTAKVAGCKILSPVRRLVPKLELHRRLSMQRILLVQTALWRSAACKGSLRWPLVFLACRKRISLSVPEISLSLRPSESCLAV